MHDGDDDDLTDRLIGSLPDALSESGEIYLHSFLNALSKQDNSGSLYEFFRRKGHVSDDAAKCARLQVHSPALTNRYLSHLCGRA